MTARQTLRYVAGFYPWVQDPIERRIDEALEMTGIAAAADRPTANLLGWDAPATRASPRPSSAGRRCSCSTNRPARSTRSAGATSSTSWKACAGRRRSSTRRTSSTTSSASPTTSRSSTRGGSFAPRRRRSCSAASPAIACESSCGGVTDATAGGLAALPGVASVELEGRDRDQATFLIQARPGQTDAVQRAVTRYAVESDLTLVTNAPEQVDLEEVFLRLIDSKERAA